MTRPGPKPGPPGSQRTARLVVRVTPLELSAYQAAAGRAGVSMGEWVRQRLTWMVPHDNGPWFCADCLRAALALLEQPPHPLDRVQEPASHADSQHGRDEG